MPIFILDLFALLVLLIVSSDAGQMDSDMLSGTKQLGVQGQ